MHQFSDNGAIFGGVRLDFHVGGFQNPSGFPRHTVPFKLGVRIQKSGVTIHEKHLDVSGTSEWWNVGSWEFVFPIIPFLHHSNIPI
jgi:hypothetical protein